MAIDVRRAQPDRPGVLTASGGVLLAVLVVLGALVAAKADWLLDLDRDASRWAVGFTSDHDVVHGLAHAISVGFDLWTWMPLALLAALFVWRRREARLAAFVLASAVTELVLNPLLKLLVQRDRPVNDDPLELFDGFSFPSGHAAAAGTGCTVLVVLTIVITRRGTLRRLLVTVWTLLALLIAASRVFYGAHYPSDVTAGLAEGVLVALVWWYVLLRPVERVPHEQAVVTGTGRKRSAVVLNPIKVGDVEVFKERVRAAASKEGWAEPLWFETTVEDPGVGQARAALEAGVDLLVAAGGDGTVRMVCQEAARTGVAVAILPHGTGNLLARNLAIPLNMRDALAVAFGGQDRAIDLARFESDAPLAARTSFLVMAGLGMDAAIMTGVDDQLKARVGYAAYFVSGLKAARFPAMKVSLTIDDQEPMRLRARTVVVGNVGFLQGGIPLLPDAQIDDGTLDVVVLAPKRFLGWLAIIVRIVGRGKRTNERLARFSGQRVLIETKEPMPMQLDGDPVGEGTRIEAGVRPGVLLVRVPVLPALPRA